MEDRGLLRWRDVIDSLRVAAFDGRFGDHLRLCQQADGTWQLLETVPDDPWRLPQDTMRMEGGVLYPGALSAGGMPVLVNGVPADAEPPPGVPVPPGWLSGAATGCVVVSRANESASWEYPATFELFEGLAGHGAALTTRLTPVALLLYGRVIRLTPL